MHLKKIYFFSNFTVLCIMWCTVPARSLSVENLLEMSDKAKLNDHDIVQLINGLVDKLQNTDLKRSVLVAEVC